ncbi:MAG TPA: hypothetical protein VN648_05610, partial [Candidatus Methylomirabilis sp.]|nr:hypothetical protein [Candidatus Methylomirabilis sp.]
SVAVFPRDAAYHDDHLLGRKCINISRVAARLGGGPLGRVPGCRPSTSEGKPRLCWILLAINLAANLAAPGVPQRADRNDIFSN